MLPDRLMFTTGMILNGISPLEKKPKRKMERGNRYVARYVSLNLEMTNKVQDDIISPENLALLFSPRKWTLS